MKKTVLNVENLRGIQRGAVAAAFALGLAGLAGCEPAEADWDKGIEQHKQDKFVQGRDKCIEELVRVGRSPKEAADICDKAFADAQAARVAAGGQQQTQQSGGGFNNALMWYLIGNNMGRSSAPSVHPYVQRPTGNGMTYAFAGKPSALTSGTSAGTAPKVAPPPAQISAHQKSYLSAPAAQRNTIANRLKSDVSARRAAARSVRAARTGKTAWGRATTRGGLSGGRSIGAS